MATRLKLPVKSFEWKRAEGAYNRGPFLSYFIDFRLDVGVTPEIVFQRSIIFTVFRQFTILEKMSYKNVAFHHPFLWVSAFLF